MLTASTSLQVAYEKEVRSREVSEPSLFTSAVVRGLATGEADLDGDGLVSVQELFSYVERRVTEARPSQTPTLSVDDAQGAIYLAASPRGPAEFGHAAYEGLSPLRDEVHRALFALVDPGPSAPWRSPGPRGYPSRTWSRWPTGSPAWV